jgi:hypothetical protein
MPCIPVPTPPQVVKSVLLRVLGVVVVGMLQVLQRGCAPKMVMGWASVTHQMVVVVVVVANRGANTL